ncbi:ABC transporter substrate-binding protein [Corynebacterium hansenii]|uniref:ABC transporter substrate-binding protein n=1 Tax=Corynebacterium hansenii TaxID=394964 RepID=A0ABV7ZRP1_9CORY|nr:ABC transporter substrate-binding protein [Corynebacterium hansenii]WJZ01128.1 Oligopeptide-binding protein AppA precursor [Corynebacterium hansenii]
MSVKKILVGFVAVGSLALAACGTGDAGDDGYPTTLKLADKDTADNFHPASGYGQTGISPIYDGLLKPDASAGSDVIPRLVPALAAEEPKANADASEWTVKLREGVTFHDGTAFDAADVKATYDVARDASKGSKVSMRYDVIDEVKVVDDNTVTFKLAYPYGGFASRLTLAIAPSELVGEGDVVNGPLGEKPVGTGAYSVTERTGDLVRYTANPDYWGGKPEVGEFLVTLASDDAARAQRVASGELDGAHVPPSVAKNFEGRSGVEVVTATTADWRGISLPKHPFLKDPAVRRALNLAVDRDAIVSGPLLGKGRAISTAVPEIYGDSHNPDATFGHDTAEAERILDEAGWRKGADGVREKDGVRAEIPLYYSGEDTLRRDVGIEFSAQMARIGVSFPTTASTWDDITPRLGEAAAVLGGGSAPWDVDMFAYDLLHTREAATSEYSNPGDYGSPELDAKLDEARRATDAGERARLYREAQAMYAENPSNIFLATIDHVYLAKENKWNRGSTILEPHIHGATWGPWWNLRDWKK